MSVYVDFGNESTNRWLSLHMGDVAEIERATWVVTSRLSVAKKAKNNRQHVLLFTDPERQSAALRVGLSSSEVMLLETDSKISITQLLQRILETVDVPLPPMVVEYDQPKFIHVVSTKASGGSFIAWNFLHYLQTQGITAYLYVLDKQSPVLLWGKDRAYIGTEPPIESEVVIVDHSGVEPNQSVLDSAPTGSVFQVFDLDPYKHRTDVQSSKAKLRTMTICNRVPRGWNRPVDAQVIVDDYGFLAMESVMDHVPVVDKEASMGKIMASLWYFVQTGDIQPRDTKAEDMPSVVPETPVSTKVASKTAERTKDTSHKETPTASDIGFDLDDTPASNVFARGAEEGFSMT